MKMKGKKERMEVERRDQDQGSRMVEGQDTKKQTQ